jgi:hypothetical protein
MPQTCPNFGLASISSPQYKHTPAKVCPACQKRFKRRYSQPIAAWNKKTYCSPECRKLATPKKTIDAPLQTKQCLRCGSTYARRKNTSQGDWNQRQYCSRQCVRNRHYPPESTTQHGDFTDTSTPVSDLTE